MEMTLQQYILNPMGKNNAVLNASMREMARANYSERFDKILLRLNGKIKYFLYKDSKTNVYYAHFKIPSEVIKDFYYDVLFKFSATESVDESGENLFKYKTKFYSNDPAFVYTYANVFINNKLFIDEFKSKMSKEAIKKAPMEKNPTKNVGYVKAIYFAYLFMENRKLNKKSRFEAEAKSFNLKAVLNAIEHADIKVKERQESDNKIIKPFREIKKKQIGVQVNSNPVSNLKVLNSKLVGSVKNNITNSKSTKKVGGVKRK